MQYSFLDKVKLHQSEELKHLRLFRTHNFTEVGAAGMYRRCEELKEEII